MSLQQLTALDPLSSGEDIRVWRSAHLPGVELMTAVHSNRLWRVFHETYAACVIPPHRNGPPETEIARFRYRRRDDVMKPGTVVLLEPGEVHANIRNVRAADFYVFFFDPAILASAARELGVSGAVQWRTSRSESAIVRTVVEQIYGTLARSSAPLESETRLAECIRTLIDTCGERRPTSPPRRHPAIQRVRDYLHAHVLEPVRLDDLAAVSGLSRYHLVQTFSRTFGLPPHAYQNQLRIAFVQRQLRGGIPPADIEAGFFDQSHMIRHFKRTVGVTPRQYVAAAAGPLPPLV